MIPPASVIAFLSGCTVLGQALILFFVCAVLIRKVALGKECPMLSFVAKHGLPILLIIVLMATCGSLYFSEIAGWTPCKLCWFQRIFMYPQLPLVLLALWRRDRGIASSILLLSSIGILFSTWHYSEQIYFNIHPDALIACDATVVSCVNSQILAFGYITIPLMAFTAFLMNIIVATTMMRVKLRLQFQ